MSPRWCVSVSLCCCFFFFYPVLLFVVDLFFFFVTAFSSHTFFFLSFSPLLLFFSLNLFFCLFSFTRRDCFLHIYIFYQCTICLREISVRCFFFFFAAVASALTLAVLSLFFFLVLFVPGSRFFFFLYSLFFLFFSFIVRPFGCPQRPSCLIDSSTSPATSSTCRRRTCRPPLAVRAPSPTFPVPAPSAGEVHLADMEAAALLPPPPPRRVDVATPTESPMPRAQGCTAARRRRAPLWP